MGVSLRPTAKSLLLGTALSLIVAGPFANAKANAGEVQEITQQVSTYIERGDSLNIVQELNLKQSLRNGDSILKISVKAQATGMKSGMKLMVNGTVQEKVQINGQMQVVSFNMPMIANVQSLALAGKGLFVKKITAQIEKYQAPRGGGNGQQGVIKVQLNQLITGGDTLKVKQLVNIHTGQKLAGKQVAKIVLRGQILTRGIKVQLLVKGNPVGMPQRLRSIDGNKLVIQVPQHVSTKKGALQIQVIRGQMHVSMMKVKLSKQGSAQNSTVIANVFQRTFRGEYLSLKQLLSKANVHVNSNQQVESIKVIASGRGALKVISNWNQVGTLQITGPGSVDQVQLHSSLSTVGNIELKVEGRMIIEQVIVKLKNARSNRWRGWDN